MIDFLASLATDAVRLELLTKIADVIFKLILGVIGLYLAHNISRHIELRVTEKRLLAYSKLWAATENASPVRLNSDPKDPLSDKERTEMHNSLMTWYYADGNGMLLAGGTRTMFLEVKDNLIRPICKLNPDSFRNEVSNAPENEADAIRGERSIQQLSMLRTRMKADLRVFGVHYGGGLEPSDIDFLKHCGERLCRKPWRKSWRECLSRLG